MISEGYGNHLGSDDKVIIKSFSHLKSPIIGQVKHPLSVSFPPMFPAVLQDIPVVDLTVQVCVLPGEPPGAVLMEAWDIRGAIGNVEPVNLAIDPVKLFLPIGVASWLRAIIIKPGKLRWVH